MLSDLLGSVSSTAAYRRFAAQKASRTMLYLAFLSFVFTAAGTVALRLRLGPVVDETFSWLEKEVPTLTFSKGAVTSAAPGPTRLAHPRAPEVAILIDTTRTTPVTITDLEDAKVLAFLSANALYMEKEKGSLTSYDLSKAAMERPVTVDAAFYREAAKALKTVVYPATILTLFLMFAAWTAFCALFYALLGLLFNSLAGGALGFGQLFQMAVHAQTASTLLRAVMAFLPFAIPAAGLVALLVTSGYLWLGVRAAARPDLAPVE
ncbi:MAG: DUF1189 family protein [Elusimicrobiota bacterium]|nr:DUF1189 family protein [Elusimicrobiota bacterium]